MFWDWNIWFLIIGILVSGFWFLFVNTNQPSSNEASNIWQSLLLFFLIYALLSVKSKPIALVVGTLTVLNFAKNTAGFLKSTLYIALPTLVIAVLASTTSSIFTVMILVETTSLIVLGSMVYFFVLQKSNSNLNSAVMPAVVGNFLMYLILLSSIVMYLSLRPAPFTHVTIQIVALFFVLCKALLTPLALLKAPIYTHVSPNKVATLTVVHTVLTTPLTFIYLQFFSLVITIPPVLLAIAASISISAAILNFKNIKQALTITTPIFVTTVTALFI